MTLDFVCALVNGEATAEVVLSTDDVIAFLDHRPVFKGHVLVCPTAHVDTLLELPDEAIMPLFRAARRVAQAVRDGLGAEGSFVAVNNVISQSVPHLHIHVVPRHKGDGLRGFFWPRTTYASGEAAAVARRLRLALAES